MLKPSQTEGTAKVHQAQFREETKSRGHAETGSDDPECAVESGVRPEDEQSPSAAQQSWTELPVSALNEEQTQSTAESYSPVQSEAPREKRVQTKKRLMKAVVSGSR